MQRPGCFGGRTGRERKYMRQFILIYIRQQKRQLFTFLLFCAIYTMVLALYQLPPAALLYPILLCAAAGAAAMGMDLYRVHKRYTSLQQLLKAVGLKSTGEREATAEAAGQELSEPEGCDWELLQELLESLEHSEDWECRIYRDMVGRLLEEQRQREDAEQIRYQDTVDYYTTWVHQIKTPIAAMGLILQQEDTECARRLSEQLQRIEQYVEMVLTYLRLGSGDTDYVFAQVDLDTLLRSCIKKYAGQFILKHVALDYQSVNCRVLTDEKWLALVVEQVLSNALKYTREGRISIYLEAPCTLCIRDTGIGIAPEDLPRIFEKGYTGYNGRSDKKATGLGLYLCRQICDRLKHTITAESVSGEGTVIRIGLGREVLEAE